MGRPDTLVVEKHIVSREERYVRRNRKNPVRRDVGRKFARMRFDYGQRERAVAIFAATHAAPRVSSKPTVQVRNIARIQPRDPTAPLFSRIAKGDTLR